MVTNIGLYAKAAFAALMAGLTTLYAVLNGSNGNISDAEWVSIAIAVVTAVGVYLFPNAKNSEV